MGFVVGVRLGFGGAGCLVRWSWLGGLGWVGLGAGLGEEFLGEAGVGQDVDGVGAAVLDQSDVAELFQGFGDVGDGGVEPVSLRRRGL